MVSAGLVGKWELRRVHGGLAGLDSTLVKGNGTFFSLKATVPMFISSIISLT